MQLVAPDLLAESRELSLVVTSCGLALGLLLWLWGWRAHRFWVVLLATLLGGTTALTSSSARGIQPLVAGLLAAVAAGILALALVRVVAFLGGAIVACVAANFVTPGLDQPLIVGLLGGLLGVTLFRLWTMTLTSGVGSLLLVYSGLSLADRLGKLDAMAWADAQTNLLNGVCGALLLAGISTQVILERRRAAAQQRKAEEAKAKAEKEKEDKSKKASKAPPARKWWPPLGRKAG